MSGQENRQNSAGREEDDLDDFESEEENIGENAPLQQTIQAPRPNQGALFQHTLRPLSADTPAAWYPPPPTGYVFQNTGSSDAEKALETTELLKQLNKKIKKPVTKADFENKGSVVQPPNGDNVKRSQRDQCLTCINQGARCQGTDVVDGECHNCRGGDTIRTATGQQKSSRATRKCRWKQPARGIWTYEDHANFYDPERRIPGNTKLGRFEREMTKRDLWPNVLDIPPQSHEGQILRWIAAGVADGGALSNNAATNLDAMITMTMRRMSYVGRRSVIPSDQTRREVVNAINEIYLRLLLWHERGRGITFDEMRQLLPYGHPQK